MPEHSEIRVVLVTVPGEEEGVKIARKVVEEKLGACANIVRNVRSIYSWKGQVCDDPEVLMVIKTTAHRFESLKGRVRELHPYDVPEIIALPVLAGWDPYLDWVRKETEG